VPSNKYKSILNNAPEGVACKGTVNAFAIHAYVFVYDGFNITSLSFNVRIFKSAIANLVGIWFTDGLPVFSYVKYTDTL